MTLESQEAPLDGLTDLLTLIGPSGDEGAVADWLAVGLLGIPEVATTRIGDSIVAVRGRPRTAVFAHTDTVGFTLGYERKLIRIGGPQPEDGDEVRCALGLTGRIRVKNGALLLRRVRTADGERADSLPGTRWVYARPPQIQRGTITSPYLDDRAGVFCALDALRNCSNIAVAFCTGEEVHGHGARVCAEYLHAQHGITQALIADITWHTDDTPCGKGVVVSLRDAFCPRQTFLDRVLALAEKSGIPHQREIQSSGSSDGGHLFKSTVPMDWVFVGAPSKKPHTSREKIRLRDLAGMADLLVYLANTL